MSDEEAIDYEELQLPPLSGQAFNAAFTQTWASGESVLVSGEGSVFRVFADGQRVFVKAIEPPTHFQFGTKIELH